MPTKEEVVEALRGVEDPELGMDIVELGLFYDAEVEGQNVKVTYTLTSMGCPAGQMIQEDIDRVVQEIPGVESDPLGRFRIELERGGRIRLLVRREAPAPLVETSWLDA